MSSPAEWIVAAEAAVVAHRPTEPGGPCAFCLRMGTAGGGQPSPWPCGAYQGARDLLQRYSRLRPTPQDDEALDE